MKKQLKWIAGLASACALVGCSPSGGTAAVVNGVAIPDAQITQIAQGCAAQVEQQAGGELTAEQLRTQIVRWAIIGQMSKQYADQHHVDISDDQLREHIRANSSPELLEDPACEAAVLGVARHDLLSLSLQSNINDYILGNEIEVNPRYGTWDATRLTLVGSGSLSEMS